MRRCVIIANSGAGSFSQKRFDRVCSQMAAAGLSIERKFCGDFEEMTSVAAAESGLQDSPVIVPAGGDGTINAVFNGLAGNRAICAILPMGTANVMALELGVNSLEHAASRIISGQSRPFTAGLLMNRGMSRRFFLMAGTGFDGHVVKGVSLREKRLLGKGAYLLSGLRSFISWDRSELHVTTESEEFSCNSLIVCNASRYGGSFLLAPSANIFSHFFEIVAFKGSSRVISLRTLAGALLGSSASGQVIRTTGGKISIRGEKPLQADGDYSGDSPAEILAEPGYAEILI